MSLNYIPSTKSISHKISITLEKSQTPPLLPNYSISVLTHSLSSSSSISKSRERKMAATVSTVIGLGSSSLSSPSRVSAPKPTSLTSGFLKSTVTVRNPLKLTRASGGKYTCFQRDWLRRDFNVIGFGLIGWLAPSSIPAIDGKSLTGLFFDSIGAELAHFPTPPALTSQFWLWLITWHLGLFICLTFGQIGFKGRTEDYF